MKLTFLGTKGNIKAKTRRHNKHSVLFVEQKNTKIIIDWGLDWLKKTNLLKKLKISGIFLTHAHPDHAEGLKYGAPYPVYATKETWEIIKKYPIEEKIVLKPYKKVEVGNLTIQTFPVIHSLRAPAVGYKISDGKSTIFYVSDLVSIIEQKRALKNVDIYIGDGASITRPIIRYRDNIPMGHTTIKNQIMWCAKEGVPMAIFTHCGSQIVKGDGRTLGAKIRKIGKTYGVIIKVAYDGMVLSI